MPTDGPALVWHRTDLRLVDNAAVTAAARAGRGGAVGVYLLPAEPHARVAPGLPRWSPRRLGHTLEALDGLDGDWHAEGSGLVVAQGVPEAVLPALAAAVGARAVHTAPCPAFDERRENAAVARALAPLGVALVVHDETTLLAPSDLPFAPEALPDVFSEFRRAAERATMVRAPSPVPGGLAVAEPALARARELGEETLVKHVLSAAREAAAAVDPRASWHVRGGRSHGLARLRGWFWEEDGIARYKETRDGLTGPDFSSKLSPWLATGALSPREVHAEVLRYEDERTRNESTYWLRFELLWRDYFHFWVRRWQARAFAAEGVRGRTPCGAEDGEAFARWCAGETGEPLVDAGMRELAATGYLSNRARQNVASWLARTARVDWRWGAAWFESRLVDFDVGPNWGNWQYVAGVGNDPRNRTFDVRWQAERYDPDGRYRRLWAAR